MTSLTPAQAAGARRGPSTRTVTVLVAAFALVLIAGAAAVTSAFRSADADQWVTHTFQVRQGLTRLLAMLTDAETGQRGYLLTADPAYLEPFQASEQALPALRARIAELVTDNAQEVQRLAQIDPLIEARRKLMTDTIALAEAGQFGAAIDLVKSDRGKIAMDSIREIINAMLDDERDLLLQRQADAATARGWLLGLIGGSLTLAVALAAFLALTARRALQDSRQRAAALAQEIAEHKETQETLRQAQKIEAVGQLTGGIAHDFNNLLTIIIGNLDTLRRRLADPATGTDVATLTASLMKPVDFALHGARSAAQLTHRLLAFSRRQPLEPTALDMNRQIAGMSDLLRRTLGETINIETILAAGLWPTFADANQVENGLLNLCVNARDAMPEGGRLTIETANTFLDEAYARQFGDVTPGQYVLLSVSDTGSGIPPELLKRAFEPFFTTKGTGQGSGLGLAMVHGFVKQTGGHVRIYSEVGHGTTVKIYLPRLMQDEVASAPPTKPAPISAGPRAEGQETILLVEDNEGVRTFARGALEELGYRVLEARDAEDALRVASAEKKIDLLFTDVVLPGLSGRELANRISAERPDLPVLFTTGYTRNAIIHHGRLDPGVQLLSKPFAQHELARKVRELLDGRRT